MSWKYIYDDIQAIYGFKNRIHCISLNVRITAGYVHRETRMKHRIAISLNYLYIKEVSIFMIWSTTSRNYVIIRIMNDKSPPATKKIVLIISI